MNYLMAGQECPSYRDFHLLARLDNLFRGMLKNTLAGREFRYLKEKSFSCQRILPGCLGVEIMVPLAR